MLQSTDKLMKKVEVKYFLHFVLILCFYSKWTLRKPFSWTWTKCNCCADKNAMMLIECTSLTLILIFKVWISLRSNGTVANISILDHSVPWLVFCCSKIKTTGYMELDMQNTQHDFATITLLSSSTSYLYNPWFAVSFFRFSFGYGKVGCLVISS